MQGSIMSTVQANPIYSRAEIGILPCSKCGKPMRLACIEPAQPGHEVRTFQCSECKTTGSFAVAIYRSQRQAGYFFNSLLVATSRLCDLLGPALASFADRSISLPAAE